MSGQAGGEKQAADGGTAPAQDQPAATPQPASDGLGFELPRAQPLPLRKAIVLIVVGAVLLAGALLVGWLPRRQARAALDESARAGQDAVLRVEVVAPRAGSTDRAMVLPGSVQPLRETVVYSRADGYVRRFLVDIGDKVTEGQLLAELETPEIDQQLDQARAQVVQAQAAIVQAKANRDYSATTYTRYETLTRQGLSAAADLDQKKAQASVDEATVTVSQANVTALEANLRRLAQLKAFARVTAPFGGTITARTLEIGTLVTAGGSATPLFKVAAMTPARVFIQVPQDVAPSVKPGVAARVNVREYAGRNFDGSVARAAGELDPTTRTMTTEVRVPNEDGALIAGMYAQVALTLPLPHRVLELPATALMNDAKGQRLAVVGDDNRLRMVPVVVERDNGATVDVAVGNLTGGERVVRLGSTELTDGRTVTVAPESSAAPTQPSPSGAASAPRAR